MSLHTLYLDIFGPSLQSTHPEAMYHVVTHFTWTFLDPLSSTHPEAMCHVVTHFTWTFLARLSHQPILRQCTMSLRILYLDILATFTCILGHSLHLAQPKEGYYVFTHT